MSGRRLWSQGRLALLNFIVHGPARAASCKSFLGVVSLPLGHTLFFPYCVLVHGSELVLGGNLHSWFQALGKGSDLSPVTLVAQCCLAGS